MTCLRIFHTTTEEKHIQNRNTTQPNAASTDTTEEQGFLAVVGIKRGTIQSTKRDSPLPSKARYAMAFRVAEGPGNPTNWRRLPRIRASEPTRSQIR
jgi:hypothetical protein